MWIFRITGGSSSTYSVSHLRFFLKHSVLFVFLTVSTTSAWQGDIARSMCGSIPTCVRRPVTKDHHISLALVRESGSLMKVGYFTIHALFSSLANTHAHVHLIVHEHDRWTESMRHAVYTWTRLDRVCSLTHHSTSTSVSVRCGSSKGRIDPVCTFCRARGGMPFTSISCSRR